MAVDLSRFVGEGGIRIVDDPNLIPENLKSGTTIFGVTGTYDPFSEQTKKAAETYTPGTTNQVILADQYLTGDQTILGDTDLVGGNIKPGVSIFGVNGSMPTKGTQTYTPGTTNQSISSGYYLTGTQTILGDTDLIASNIKTGVTIFGVTSSMASKAAQTYTPGTSNQTISSGQYLTGNQTIQGDADLIADNIIQGKNIFGVEGAFLTYYGVATGTAPTIQIDTSKNYKVVCIYNGGSEYVTLSKIESGVLSRVETVNGDVNAAPTLSGTTLTLGSGDSTSDVCYNIVMQV